MSSRWLHRAQKAFALARGGFRGYRVPGAAGQSMLLPRSVGVFFWTGRNEDVVLFDFLAASLPDDGVYMDVGGNVGLYVTALTKAKRGRLRSAFLRRKERRPPPDRLSAQP